MSSRKPDEKKSKDYHFSEKKTAFEELAEEHGVELKDTTPMPGIRYCPKCGYANTPDDDKCFNCHSHFERRTLHFGKALKQLEDDDEEPKGKKRRRR